MHRLDLKKLFGTARPIIGMVHLAALPGAPDFADMSAVVERALADAAALAYGGVHGIMIENFGDAPFFPGTVPPETVAALTRATVEVRRATTLPIGVNVLRNDARAALGIAAATGAAFIRVNVHVGAMLTDQGWISGMAHDTLRTRVALGADVAILADVLVKHAVAPAGLSAADAARDCWERGRADALIVSGAATGVAAPADRLAEVRSAVPAAPLLIGSGLTAGNSADLLAHADGAIVGSTLKGADGAVDVDRVRALMKAVAAVEGRRGIEGPRQ
jgi:uncharacterized protein